MSFRPANHTASDSISWILKCTDLPQYDALLAQADLMQTNDIFHLRNLCSDSIRCAGMTAIHLSPGQRKIILDYSRQRVTGETMELLFDLADAVGLTDRKEAMRCGKRINATENRAVLHHVLRMPADYALVLEDPPEIQNNAQLRAALPDGPTLLKEVESVRQRIKDFSENVRSGQFLSAVNKKFRNVICIAIGGLHVGPQCISEALRADPIAAETSNDFHLTFIGNVDPVDFYLCTRDLDPAETLVVISSRTFATAETMLNARTVLRWLTERLQQIDGSLSEKDIVAKHMLAVSCSVARCVQFGIRKEHIFTTWDWVGDRYSSCSAVGLLPLSIVYSYSIMEEFLKGAHNIDEHFFHAPPRDNIPVIMGLLGVWNSTFLGYSCRAVFPYSQALHRFHQYVQQVDMGSNGKRVALDGTPLLHRSGEINIGGAGTISQHSIFQLLHQGRIVPCDFIGFMESQYPVELSNEAVSNHDELMSNFFAQPDALAYGKTLVDLVQEGVPEPLREHMVFSGNRPSSSILMTRLDPFALGQLFAMYEHRTAVQGLIWGINSFDQYGVQLGKTLSKHVRNQISATRNGGASVQGFNFSTSSLLEHYLLHTKYKEPSMLLDQPLSP